MSRVFERIGDLRTHDERAERHSRSERLGYRDNIGLYPSRSREPFAGAPHALLDLVGDEKYPMLAAELRERPHLTRRRDYDADISSDRLEDHRRHLFRRQV